MHPTAVIPLFDIGKVGSKQAIAKAAYLRTVVRELSAVARPDEPPDAGAQKQREQLLIKEGLSLSPVQEMAHA